MGQVIGRGYMKPELSPILITASITNKSSNRGIGEVLSRINYVDDNECVPV